MPFDLQVTKSDNFVGPMGWGTILQDSQLYFIVHKQSEGLVDASEISVEDYFEKNKKELTLLTEPEIKSGLNKYVASFLEKFALSKDQINVGAVVIKGGRLYAIISGKFEIYLFRGENSVKLGEGVGGRTYIEGVVEDKDTFLISTRQFFVTNPPSSLFVLADGVLRQTKNTPYLNIKITKISEKDQGGFVVHKGNFSGDVEDIVDVDRESTVSRVGSRNFLDSLKYPLKYLRFRNFVIKKEDYEKSYSRKKNAAWVGILLLVILGASIFFGVKNKNEQSLKNSYKSDLLEARHKLDEALGIFTLNEGRARELFYQSRELANIISQKGIDDPDFLSLKSDLEINQGKILGEYKVDAELFVGLDLLTDNFNGQKIVISNGQVYVADKVSRKIIKIEISTKRSEMVAGPNKIDEISDTTSYKDRVFVFNSDGIFEVSAARERLLEGDFGNTILAAAFAGNLYVLDKSNSKILRFPSDGQFFGVGKDWLSESVTTNLILAKTMVIDGAIWVLTDDGKLYKFVQGSIQNFKFDTSSVGEIKMDDVFASEDSEGIYFLDKDQGKIFVFTKDGEYTAQYLTGELNNTSAIVVSENERKIILLNGSKLLSIELKHLNEKF